MSQVLDIISKAPQTREQIETQLPGAMLHLLDSALSLGTVLGVIVARREAGGEPIYSVGGVRVRRVKGKKRPAAGNGTNGASRAPAPAVGTAPALDDPACGTGRLTDTSGRVEG
jgi:hypothetical protein